MVKIRPFVLYTIMAVLLTLSSSAHEIEHEQTSLPTIGIDEKLGEQVTLDLRFHDEYGKEVALRELIDKPTILSLVYHSCKDICPRIQSGVAGVIGKMNMIPGKDYKVITLSFDENDKPPLALEKKKNYIKAIGEPFPEEAWRFLTGTPESIRALTDAVGFRFKREGDGFEHPAALIVLSPDGKIVRYLYGLTYLPLDVTMAITEASKGRVGPTIRRVLLFCYSYDPQGRTYVFNILKVTGTVIVFFAAVLLVFLMIKGKNRTR